jgi:hypothetical protein
MTKRGAFFLSFFALLVTVTASTGFVPLPGSVMLKKVASPFNGDLSVLEDQAHGVRYLLARSRQGLVVQSTINLVRKQELTMGYFQLMALLTALHPRPEQVFNMGLGGGALSRFHLGKYPKSQVVSAEIDPAVIDLANQYFYVSDARHRIVVGDGFDALKAQSAQYDVVWVDTITPKEGPKAYVQARNLNVLREHLKADGLIVANLGESKTTESFSGVERSYHQGYAHGIRVRSPLPLHDETPAAILTLVTAGTGESVPELLPSYFVAVGNQASLNCAEFWKLYRKWKSAKAIQLDWGTTDGVCDDL